MAPKDVMKAAAVEWKQLSPSQRQPFEAPYQAEMRVYKTKFEEYVASGKKDAFDRDPEKPKKPLTGFMQFTQEFRKSHMDLKVTEVTKNASAKWKSMSEAQQKPYNDKYKSEKLNYDQAMKKYKESGKEDVWKEKVGLAAVEAKKKDAIEKVKDAAQKKKAAEKQKREKAAAAKKKEVEAKVAAKAKAAAKKKKEAEAKAAAKAKAAAANAKAKKAAALAKEKEALAKKKMAAQKKDAALTKAKKAAAAEAKAKKAAAPKAAAKAKAKNAAALA